MPKTVKGFYKYPEGGIYLPGKNLFRTEGISSENVSVDVNLNTRFSVPEITFKDVRPYLLELTDDYNKTFEVIVFCKHHSHALLFVAEHYHGLKEIKWKELTSFFVLDSLNQFANAVYDEETGKWKVEGEE